MAQHILRGDSAVQGPTCAEVGASVGAALEEMVGLLILESSCSICHTGRITITTLASHCSC